MGYVHYTVPVVVHVEGGRVQNVTVLDEAIALDETTPSDPAEIEVAETSEWPGWRFGF